MTAEDHRDAPDAVGPTPGPADIATDLLRLVDLEPAQIGAVRFTGPPTVLASSFRITDASQALVAAASVAVARVADARATDSTEQRAIVVDSVESAVAFQSERHLNQQGGTSAWDGLSGHYETADGHIQFHTNFPHHRDALLAATGQRPGTTRDEVATMVARTNRFELEQDVAEAGGIAAALRSLQEWRDHPHCSHVAGRPPIRFARLPASGDAAPPPRLRSAPADRPLAGIRVIDLTRVIAGPVCARTLAAYGADVLRIGAEHVPVVDSILPDTTLGKRFAHCDISTDAGRQRVLDLTAEADIVVTGYRPGALEGHGLGRRELLAANPKLIIGTLSAFGSDGPWGGKRGFDSITQTATGIVATETAAFGSVAPRPLPCQLLDHGSGFLLSLGILAALAGRLETGRGAIVDVSLLTTRNWLESLGSADPDHGDGLTPQQVAPLLESRPSVFGPITHVRHPGRIDGIPARWDRGPSMPGGDDAEWLPG